jgi:isoleucyl-tRNA synthetase
VLATELTDALIAEGWARDLIRVIQDMRKEVGCNYTDRIRVRIQSVSDGISKFLDAHRSYIANETLAKEILSEHVPPSGPVRYTIGPFEMLIIIGVEM